MAETGERLEEEGEGEEEGAEEGILTATPTVLKKHPGKRTTTKSD